MACEAAVPGDVLTLAGTLEWRARQDPDGPVVTFLDTNQTFTARALYTSAASVAAEFQRSGVSAGDRIAIVISNRVEFLVGFFAASLAGGIPVPLDPVLKGAGLDQILSDSSPRVVLCEPAAEEAVQRSLERAGLGPIMVTLADHTSRDRLAPLQRALRVEILDGDGFESPGSHWSDVATILFTSGTTGRPKGVMVSHRMAIGFTESVQHAFTLTPDDVTFSPLPLCHVNGLFITFLSSLRSGGRAVVAERFSASSYWEQVERSGATVLSMLGSMAPILLSRPEPDREEGKGVRIANVTPDPPPGFAARFSFPITSMYGMTDVGAPIGGPPDPSRPAGSCGRVHPAWECIVADEYDVEVPRGSVGQLLVRPRAAFLSQSGYWQREQATVDAWRNLWFHTNDLFRVDDDGWFFFVGRASDSIRRSGENVSAVAVEAVLESHPAVVEAAVYGIPSSLGEEEVVAAVVLAPAAGITPDELAAHCHEGLPYFAVPRYFRFLTRLPKTETEKVRKVDLRNEGLTSDTQDIGPSRRTARVP